MLSFKQQSLTLEALYMSSLTSAQIASTVGLLRITNDHLSNYLYGLNIDTDLLTLYGTAANIIAYFTFNSLMNQFFEGIGSLKKIPDQARDCIKDGAMAGKKLNKACTHLGSKAGSLFISDTIGKIAAKFLANTVHGRHLSWKNAFTLHRAEISHVALIAGGAFAVSYLRTNP